MGINGRGRSGFTLIEVLIATVLLSLLMLVAGTLYNYVSQNWQRNQSGYRTALEQFKDWSLVQNSLNNTYPKLVFPNRATTTEEVNALFPGFYFLGKENGFTAITLQSVQRPNVPAVYRLFKEPDLKNTGRWMLVYEEALLENILLKFADQNLPFNFRRVLLVNSESVEFRYKGWASLEQRLSAYSEAMQENYTGEWQTEYDGLQTMLHPVEVQVLATNLNWYLTIASEKISNNAVLAEDL